MNRQNFIQSGGFPLQTETLDNMQTAYELFNSLGNIAGNFSIILGCEVVGSTVSNGAVFINGELLEFRGGQIGTDVIIVQEVTSQEFEDGNDKEVVFVRYATFGIGLVSFPWTNFKRPKTTIELTEQKAEQTLIETLIERIEDLEARPVANVPIDIIAMWGRPANEIPDGWIEYQPLRGKMPIGMDPADNDLDVVGTAGGNKEHTLTIAEMPSHSHEFDNMQGGGTANSVSDTVAAVGDATSQTGHVTGLTGDGEAFSIMNPFRVVHFIQYKG